MRLRILLNVMCCLRLEIGEWILRYMHLECVSVYVYIALVLEDVVILTQVYDCNEMLLNS